MAKLFLFSTGYLTRILLKEIKYIFNFSVDEVILLRENHYDDFLECYNLPIHLFNNIRECIDNSDMVIIINNEMLPSKIVDDIKATCVIRNKLCIELPLNSFEDSYKSYIKMSTNSLSNDRPIILLISIGKATEHSYIEILLNKIFTENNVVFGQVFSPFTLQLLNSLSVNNILQSKLLNQLSLSDSTKDMYIITISIDCQNEFIKYSDFLKRFTPDYVMLQLSLGYLNHTELVINNELVNPNLVLRSRYRLVNGEFAVYCNEEVSETINELDIDSIAFEDKIAKKIISHLALPAGIRRL